MSDLARNIGAAIRSYRTRADLSQEELAEAARVTAHFVSLVETGRRLPSLGALERFAKALGAKVAQLVAEGPPDRSANPTDASRVRTLYETEMIERLRELDDRERTAVRALVRQLARRRAR